VKLSELHMLFITSMVLDAFRVERSQIKHPDLLTDAELLDLHYAYMGM
jgi:hypothetical protein